jgi:hypothetical protein
MRVRWAEGPHTRRASHHHDEYLGMGPASGRNPGVRIGGCGLGWRSRTVPRWTPWTLAARQAAEQTRHGRTPGVAGLCLATLPTCAGGPERQSEAAGKALLVQGVERHQLG